MRRIKNLFSILLTLMLTVGLSTLTAQETYRLGKGQEFKVEGTSTLHDWDMESSEARGEGVFEINDNKIESISSLLITLPAKSLKSGNSRMERLAYSALEADKHEQIRFELTEVRNITANSILADGNLTIAGTTRRVTLRTEYKVNGNSVSFSGKHNIKFSDFNMDSPTALFGTIKTGDELELSFNVDLSPEGLFSAN